LTSQKIDGSQPFLRRFAQPVPKILPDLRKITKTMLSYHLLNHRIIIPYQAALEKKILNAD